MSYAPDLYPESMMTKCFMSRHQQENKLRSGKIPENNVYDNQPSYSRHYKVNGQRRYTSKNGEVAETRSSTNNADSLSQCVNIETNCQKFCLLQRIDNWIHSQNKHILNSKVSRLPPIPKMAKLFQELIAKQNAAYYSCGSHAGGTVFFSLPDVSAKKTQKKSKTKQKSHREHMRIILPKINNEDLSALTMDREETMDNANKCQKWINTWL